MKLLDGTELAGYVKERQAKQVRNLRQAHGVAPRLAIVQTRDDPVIDTYVRIKQQYGDDIAIDVEIHRPDSASLNATIEQLNSDQNVHGIIVQLPLAEGINADDVLNAVSILKDVDGLAQGSTFTAATAQAIDWLLNGYNVELRGKKIAIVGNGRLVGSPLAALWRGADYDVTVFDEHSSNMAKQLRRYPIVISAAGVPNLITSESVQPGAVLVDAATSAEHGKIVGDVSADVRLRGDITITPEKGGVGPLTVVSLFDNVIRAARSSVDSLTG
ncbi:bifunctional 5,10-methylenetetrahydrofolate dehydrogenase/5,10-methenyltetrahydrofolate cyclohydrolase [Candidatus Saccharibacteria bacterium]|nr:bifunctional 5,10-methylenetetrahydrofolate dehydrogenase/5,10-methenyltetrahydrofolate cyclohydrolase [Candidatus Saccharibacteria bacterium]